MIFWIRTIIGSLIVLLGLIHIGFAFPVGVFDTDDLWFIGAGIAIVFSGIINIIAVINCQQRWLGYLTLASNVLMLVLFLFSRQVLKEPQVYVAIYLYLAAVLLPATSLLKINKKSGGNQHTSSANPPDLKEV